MTISNNRVTGNKGEDKAEEYLRGIGYKIIDRNIKLVCGEVDILAQDKGTIVLVEVKTVRGRGFGLAQDLVRYRKQNKLRQLGRALTQKYSNKTIRIDVVGVDLSGGEAEIEHLINCIN